MSNEVKNSEKKSKSIMRNSKAFRYSRNLMFIVGAMGVTTGVLLSNTGKVKANDKNNDDNLNNTVDETQSMLKKMRNRNKMYIRGANLELIQLMEQGDQIIKSPWSSWQFGMNFFSNANIVSEGYGDREAMYGGYEGQYIRGNWSERNLLIEGRYLPGVLNQNNGYNLFYSSGKTPNYGFANLNNTVDETQSMLKKMRNRNKMYIRGANLELIQLMEQGDQIIKSPWSSWQFGMNFFSNANIVSEGYGDKQEKYTYNGLYFRNNWKMKNALASSDALGAMGMPITPGNDSQTSWKNANGDAFSSINFDMTKGSSVNGEVRWGLVELRKIQEPLNEVEILARISPKEVKKEAVSLNVAEPTVEIIEAPVINPQVNTPLAAPNITIPSVTAPTIPAAP